GGGMYIYSTGTGHANVTLNADTITANTAAGGGIDRNGLTPSSGDQVALSNTLIAGNTGPAWPDVAGAFTSHGYNLNRDPTGSTGIANGVNGDLVGSGDSPIDPRLRPLANNGSPTKTHALLAGSPAVDAGSPAAPGSGAGACPVTDQRGSTRPQGARCDIGAI